MKQQKDCTSVKKMKRVKFFLILLPAIFLILLPQSVRAETIDLTPAADSFVNNVYPEQNQGAAHSLIVSRDSAFRWSLVRFDLSSVPTDSIIDSAMFKAYLYDSSGDASVPIMAARITGDWTETEVKWNNRPLFDESTGVTANIDTATSYKSWDVTEIVRGWHDNDFSNYGLALGYGSGNYSRSFRSREYASDKPLLTINYHLPEPTPTPSPTPTPTPSPTPLPSPKPSPTPSPEITEEPSPEPGEGSPTPTPKTEKAGLISGLTTRQTIIGGLVILALIGAGVAFAAYARKKPAKKLEKPEEKEFGD